MTRLRSRIRLEVWGAIGILAGLAILYVIFGGRAGLAARPFVLKAAFRSDAALVENDPVRIAGVTVGRVAKVTSLGAEAGASLVTMRIDRQALPLHADATAKVRSRLLLEGNFYVQLTSGTPSAPRLRSGATIGVDRTAGPVQLDRILTALPLDRRMSLRTVVQGLGQSIGARGGTGVPQDPRTRGETAGQALNDSLGDTPEALLGTARVTEGLLGLDPHDLSGALRGQSRFARAFADRERQLGSLIDGFDTTMGAFAAEQDDLRQAIGLLPGTLGRARRAFDALNPAFPPTRALARALTPSIRQLPATITAAGPWIAQARRFVSRREGGRLAAALRPTARDAARALAATQPLVSELSAVSRCASADLVPTGDAVIKDPPLTGTASVFQEFLQGFTGLASAFQNFDGNGYYGRVQTGGGDVAVATAPFFTQGPLRGNTTRPPLGTRPAYAPKAPPYRPDVPCSTQRRPDLDGAATGPTP